MRIIITRHGETEQNKERILQGQGQGDLSLLGKEQARKVANRLKEERIDHIFSSPLSRAKDTAEEIRKFHADTPFELRDDLKEIHMGAFQGKPAPADLAENRWNKDFFKATGGENYSDLDERINNFLKDITPKFKGKTVLVVAHNGTNQSLIAALLGKNWEHIKEIGKLKNTSITIFELNEDNKPTLKLMDCAKHLE